MDTIRIYPFNKKDIEVLAELLELDPEDIIADFMDDSWDLFLRSYLNDEDREEYREEREKYV